MDIISDSIPDIVSIMSYLFMAIMVAISLFSAPWHKIRDNTAQHVYLGTIVAIMLMWLLRVELQNGLNFHLLGSSLAYLMFGWQFAMLATIIMTMANALLHDIPATAIALNWLIQGFYPVTLTLATLYIAQRLLPLNYFIYIFVNAFFIVAFGIYTSGSLSAVAMILLDIHSSSFILDQYLPALIFMMIPEAFLTGMIMSLLVVYKPVCVSTFRDDWYLKNK